MTAKEYLKEKLEEEVLLYENKIEDLDVSTFNQILYRWSEESHFLESPRFDSILELFPDAKKYKILDMSAGCGSFVLQGLLNDWNVFGVEPEEWKQELIDIKFDENNYPTSWRNNIVKGIGEKLPFKNNTYDLIDSWQTFEHVQNIDDCLKEFYRVLKDDGKGILRCPNYMSFYEGHYRMFWFPMLHGKLAKFYLKLHGRPLGGLATFNPVSKAHIWKLAKKNGFKVTDLNHEQVKNSIRKKMKINSTSKLTSFFVSFISLAYRTLKFTKSFYKEERRICLLLTK